LPIGLLRLKRTFLLYATVHVPTEHECATEAAGFEPAKALSDLPGFRDRSPRQIGSALPESGDHDNFNRYSCFMLNPSNGSRGIRTRTPVKASRLANGRPAPVGPGLPGNDRPLRHSRRRERTPDREATTCKAHAKPLRFRRFSCKETGNALTPGTSTRGH
jgi:hypothetical protein